MNNTATAQKLIELAHAKGLTLGVVESCTGGGLGAVITSVSGSSKVFAGGLVTYSNTLKHTLAHVPEALLSAYGAVSNEVAEAMASGGRTRLGVDVCVAITGIAGPKSDDTAKPVGLVYIACAGPDSQQRVAEFHFSGNREAVRHQSIAEALNLALEAVSA